MQDLVTRGGKFVFLYTRCGRRVIINAGGHMMVAPSSFEAWIQQHTIGELCVFITSLCRCCHVVLCTSNPAKMLMQKIMMHACSAIFSANTTTHIVLKYMLQGLQSDSKQCAMLKLVLLLNWPACQQLQVVARLAAVQCAPGSTTYWSTTTILPWQSSWHNSATKALQME